MTFCYFDAFLGNFIENFSFYKKNDYFRKEHWNTLRIFSYHVWKEANPEENLDLFKQHFFNKSVKADKYLKKTVFLLKLSHIFLNYFFRLFWSIWGGIYRELSNYYKSYYRRNEHWNNQPIFFSLNVWKGANPEENLDLFKQLFLNKPVIEDKY